MDVCRHCGLEIQWAKTENGRPMPVNVTADPDGNVIWLDDGKTVHVLHKDETTDKPRFKAHFATCAHRNPPPEPEPSRESSAAMREAMEAARQLRERTASLFDQETP